MIGALAAGVALGLAGLDPRLWPLAWAGVAGLSWSVARVDGGAAPPWRALPGLALGVLVTHAIWFSWGASMARAEQASGALALALTVGLPLATALPKVVTLSLALWLLGRLPVCLWLPLAWEVGERAQSRWLVVASDWVFTQVEVPPVLRAVGHLGMWGASLACLCIAACVGEAAARRRPAGLALAGALAAALCCLPALDPGELSLIERVGVVHARSLDEMPAIEGAELDLVVWPEVAFAARPALSEGDAVEAALDAPLAGPATAHLAGFETLLHSARQNSALVISPEGQVRAARAKTELLPVFERRFLGLGRDEFVPGARAPLLRVGERAVVPLICGEILSRDLVAEGRAAGGRLIAVLASDIYQARRELVRWQVLAHVRLRAVEYGMPAVYASLDGRSAMVAADGRVLAESAPGAPSGVLSWSARGGAQDHAPQPSPSVAVIYARSALHLRPDCPPGRCSYHRIEDVEKQDFQAPPRKTVIVAGHGAPPRYLDRDASAVASAVARFRPELVVIDACFGASSPLFEALAQRLGEAAVVAAPAMVAGRGFRYAGAFFADAPASERAEAVATLPRTRLFRGHIDLAQIQAASLRVADASGDELRPLVRSWVPTLVAVPLQDGQEILVPADWKKIGRPPQKPR